MSLKLNGATSGSIELDVPAAIGSDLNITIPATAGEVAVKGTDGSVDLGDVNIDSSGRLLVGTSSAFDASANLQAQGEGIAFKRDTNSNGVNNGLIRFYSGSGLTAQIYGLNDGAQASGDTPGALVFSTTANGASSPTERMRMNSTGRSLFYSTSDGLVSVVSAGAGTSTSAFICGHSATSTLTGSASLYVYSNGNVVNTNNSYGAISDIKLKENIVDASSQWFDIKALQVRKYNFKEGQTHTQIGLIAQEVELVSPGLVSESPDRDEDGNDLGTVTKSVNYSVLYMKAVKALQEAMERIETLETEMAAVKAQLS